MAKRIIVLSDGTGNAAAKVWRSNVWRVFELLDLSGDEQVARYDDGVGTSAFKPLAVLGGAFGWGLKRNVLDLYKFLCRHYHPDNEIFAFGFSRGAFTIRVLLGFVNNQGLVRFTSEADLDAKARAAYRAYRAERYHSVLGLERVFRAVRDVFLSLKNRARYSKQGNLKVDSIRFVGVWDTVAAYGLPIEEMTRGVSQWIWPLELPDRTLSPKIKRACHALALDDERTTFHPLLWTESKEDPVVAENLRRVEDERLSQVWFPGMHSNVGGGYPDDSLAHIPLYWIMTQARQCGLLFKAQPDHDPDAFLRAKSSRDKDGRMYDSRAGLGGYYRYGPRKIQDLSHARFSNVPDDAVEIALPKIHESAFKRIRATNAYAPIGLPPAYAVVDDNGEVLKDAANPYESPDQARARANAQERVWNTVWKRRAVYFLTVAASAHLALFPVLYQTDKAAEYSTPFRPVSELLRAIGSVLPGFANWWIDAFAANPGRFLLGAGLLAAFILWGVRLGGQITDGMLAIWRSPASNAALPADMIYKLRTSPPYRWVLWAMKRHAVPFLSALLLLYCGFAVLSHVSFNILDATGMFCRESPNLADPANKPETLPARFPIDRMCWPTGIRLVQGERYVVKLTRDPPDAYWNDGKFPVDDIAGFEIAELDTFGERATMLAGLPLRRVLLRPWFRPIARIGSTGTDEYFLDPPVATPLRKPNPDEVVSSFRARRTGELFLYVNDAVIGIPGLAGLFYRNNRGAASVSVCHDRPPRACEGAGNRQ
jgi:uncharacterized protein (DUF2235 family)